MVAPPNLAHNVCYRQLHSGSRPSTSGLELAIIRIVNERKVLGLEKGATNGGFVSGRRR
jgi:hypothetical protein